MSLYFFYLHATQLTPLVAIHLFSRHLARVTDVEATDTSNPNLNYGVVVDCGSSGSRVFVYTWPRHNGNPHDLLDIRQMRDQHRKPVVMKIKPGQCGETGGLVVGYPSMDQEVTCSNPALYPTARTTTTGPQSRALYPKLLLQDCPCS